MFLNELTNRDLKFFGTVFLSLFKLVWISGFNVIVWLKVGVVLGFR